MPVLSKDPINDNVHFLGGSQDLYNTMNIELDSGVRPKLFDIRSPKVELDYPWKPLPIDYRCLLRFTGSTDIMEMESTNEICLLDNRHLSDEFWTMAQIVYENGSKIDRDTSEDSESDYASNEMEKRIYVNYDRMTASSVYFKQKGFEHWMTIFS